MPSPESPSSESFEEYPLTRNEYISAMVHFYRGEMNRAMVWRTRLDTSTNWAVLTTGAMLSFAFSQPHARAHAALLLANVLVACFLGFEARRYRYFDVWRSRIRMLEENFYIPIIRRSLVSPRSDWREWVAEDLDHPTFKITFIQAVGMRLRRNYIWLFLATFAAWLVKVEIHPGAADSLGETVSRMAIGPAPGAVVLVAVLLFYALLLALTLGARRPRGPSDEVEGVEKAMDHWKT
jgi:uncharacterized membrane protein